MINAPDEPAPDQAELPVPALGVLGLDTVDEQVYRVLLERGEVAPAELAAILDCPTARVARILDRLHQHGLVTRLGGRTRRYGASEPGAALNALVRARGAELERVRTVAAELAALFRAARGADGAAGTIEVLTGREAIGRWFVRLQQQAQHDMIALDRPPYALAATNPVQPVSLARGVRWRTIYAPEALEVPGALSEIRHLMALGEQARVLSGLPLKLAIADRRVALLPLTHDTAAMDGIVIHESTLLDALVALFECYWERAIPLDVMARPSAAAAGERQPVACGDHACHPLPGTRSGDAEAAGGAEPAARAGRLDGAAALRAVDPLGEDDRDLLALLVGGLKDDAIARQLGMSTRTMRRRIRRLLDLLGAENRFQAGVQATRRGWV